MTALEPQFRPPGKFRSEVELLGVGHYFPEHTVLNEQLAGLCDIDADWIIQHTGVHTRHWPDVTVERHVDMAEQAVQFALDSAGVSISEIGILLATSGTARAGFNPSTRHNRYPDIGLPLQAAIGASNALVLDLQGVACFGFIAMTMTASALLAACELDTALVVAAENPEPILDFGYRSSTLFGGGAAAAVWRHSPGSGGLIDACFHADGGDFDDFDIDERGKMIMHGKRVGKIGTPRLISAAREVLERSELNVDQVDWFIPHQANINMIHTVNVALGFPPERVLTNIAARGNTSSVGALSCLSEHVHSGQIKPGDTILTCAIGRGYTWGAMLYRYGEAQ